MLLIVYSASTSQLTWTAAISVRRPSLRQADESGNARLQGLEATVLGGSDARFSLALSLFFVT